MRGTIYAIAEIVWWMLAAAAIGFAIGWIVSRWRGAGAGAVDLQASLDAERSRATHLAEALAARVAAAEALEEKLAATTAQMESLRSDVAAKVVELNETETGRDAPEPEERVEAEDSTPPG